MRLLRIAGSFIFSAVLFGGGAMAQEASGKQELIDRAWFVGMAAGARCLAKTGKIQTSEGFKRHILYNLKRRNK